MHSEKTQYGKYVLLYMKVHSRCGYE